jgi:ABC-type uncharacterized transport system permease subunit
MNDLFSIVYAQAPLCAAFIALAYAALAMHGWLHSSATSPASWLHRTLIGVASGHTLLLVATVWTPHHSGGIALSLGFAQALSLATCVGVWLFIIESRWLMRDGMNGIDGLRPLALSLPALAVILAAWITPMPVVMQSGAALHVLVAIAAHGVALLACGHGLLLLALNRVLKNGSTTGWAQVLAQQCPPLVMLEQLLIRLSLWVAALLTATFGLGLLSGLLKLDHKTVFTGISLLAWLAIPWGYHHRNWRGARLCAAVLIATGLLILAYIGSRFVLQAVLHR